MLYVFIYKTPFFKNYLFQAKISLQFFTIISYKIQEKKLSIIIKQHSQNYQLANGPKATISHCGPQEKKSKFIHREKILHYTERDLLQLNDLNRFTSILRYCKTITNYGLPFYLNVCDILRDAACISNDPLPCRLI